MPIDDWSRWSTCTSTEDDYSIDCGELEDTEVLVAGRSLRQGADD